MSKQCCLVWLTAIVLALVPDTQPSRNSHPRVRITQGGPAIQDTKARTIAAVTRLRSHSICRRREAVCPCL